MTAITGTSDAEYLAKLALEKKDLQKSATQTESVAETDDSDYQTILAKANSGQQLSQSELTILREKNPAAYAKAVKTDTARQELRDEMEKSPSQAGQALRNALTSLSNKNDEDGKAITKALNEEYNYFATKYDQSLIGSQFSG
jgi:hypothetical protein